MAHTYQELPTNQRYSWGINSTLPEKSFLEELFYGFQQNALTQIIFHKMLSHDMQENHDEEKTSKPWLIIIFVGGIVRQELLDISADELTNSTGVLISP